MGSPEVKWRLDCFSGSWAGGGICYYGATLLNGSDENYDDDDDDVDAGDVL